MLGCVSTTRSLVQQHRDNARAGCFHIKCAQFSSKLCCEYPRSEPSQQRWTLFDQRRGQGLFGGCSRGQDCPAHLRRLTAEQLPVIPRDDEDTRPQHWTQASALQWRRPTIVLPRGPSRPPRTLWTGCARKTWGSVSAERNSSSASRSQCSAQSQGRSARLQPSRQALHVWLPRPGLLRALRLDAGPLRCTRAHASTETASAAPR